MAKVKKGRERHGPNQRSHMGRPTDNLDNNIKDTERIPNTMDSSNWIHRMDRLPNYKKPTLRPKEMQKSQNQ